MKYRKTAPFLAKVSDFLPRRNKVLKSTENLSCEPFFFFGSGRNGSTLVSAILDQHSQIMVPTEMHRFANGILKYKLLNFLEWRDLVNIILGDITAYDGSDGLWNLSTNKLLTRLQLLPPEQRSLRKIYDEIYLEYGRQHEASANIWGDKTPRNTEFIREIYKVYPKSKYVFLLRDGRGVVSSWIKRDKTDDIKSRSDFWNMSINQYKFLKKRLGDDQLTIVKYEDLVTDTETTLVRMVNFLGFEFEKGMLNFQGFTDKLGKFVEQSNFQKIRGSINPGSLGKWKNQLSASQIEFLNREMRNNLLEFGYSID